MNALSKFALKHPYVSAFVVVSVVGSVVGGIVQVVSSRQLRSSDPRTIDMKRADGPGTTTFF